MFIRRLGQNRSALSCYGTYGCPDIWELDNGDFAVVGTDMTEHADKLPTGAACAPYERMVRIPRKVLVLAKPDIPDAI